MTFMEGDCFRESCFLHMLIFQNLLGSDWVKKKKKRKLQFNRLNFVILLPEIDLDEESFRDVPWINKDEDTEPAN